MEPNRISKCWHTAMMLFALESKNTDWDKVRHAIDKGADISKHKNRVFADAVRQKQDDIVDICLEKGVSCREADFAYLQHILMRGTAQMLQSVAQKDPAIITDYIAHAKNPAGNALTAYALLHMDNFKEGNGDLVAKAQFIGEQTKTDFAALCKDLKENHNLEARYLSAFRTRHNIPQQGVAAKGRKPQA